MLGLIIIVPIIGALLGGVVPSRLIKAYGLILSIITFWLSLVVYLQYDNSTPGYQLSVNLGAIDCLFAIDGLSLPFVLLTGFITPVVILASWNSIAKYVKGFILGQLLIEGLLIAVWAVTDVFSFYIAFEAVLVPLFITVGVWGGSPTRVRSAFLLFMFTLSGSLLMLMSLIIIYTNLGTGVFAYVGMIQIETQAWVWLGIFLAFAIKTPMVPFHMWLPRAHADAPLAASMVLAGTVLKMATYGYLRLCIGLMPVMTAYFMPMALALGGISLVYSSLATIRQSDMKAIIAYSSIGHMGVVILGIFSNSVIGIIGGITLSLAHGVVSPALFILTGGVLYDRFHTRTIYYYRGMSTYMPIFAIVFFVAICCNMGVPLTMNWLGEFLTLVGVFTPSVFMVVVGGTGIVLSAAYSVWLYVRMVFGAYSTYLVPSANKAVSSEGGGPESGKITWLGGGGMDMTRREYYCVVYLLVPAVVFGVYAEPITDMVNIAVTALIW